MASMDEIDRELISLLGTKIDMLMEDHSILALSLGSLPEDQQTTAVIKLVDASKKIEKLATAAQAILD